MDPHKIIKDKLNELDKDNVNVEYHKHDVYGGKKFTVKMKRHEAEKSMRDEQGPDPMKHFYQKISIKEALINMLVSGYEQLDEGIRQNVYVLHPDPKQAHTHIHLTDMENKRHFDEKWENEHDKVQREFGYDSPIHRDSKKGSKKIPMKYNEYVKLVKSHIKEDFDNSAEQLDEASKTYSHETPYGLRHLAAVGKRGEIKTVETWHKSSKHREKYLDKLQNSDGYLETISFHDPKLKEEWSGQPGPHVMHDDGEVNRRATKQDTKNSKLTIHHLDEYGNTTHTWDHKNQEWKEKPNTRNFTEQL